MEMEQIINTEIRNNYKLSVSCILYYYYCVSNIQQHSRAQQSRAHAVKNFEDCTGMAEAVE